MTPAAVYKHYNKSGHLLYVGCSKNPKARLSQHKSNSAWGGDIDRVEYEWFDAVEDALRFEKVEIFRLQPIHNKMGKRLATVHITFRASEDDIDRWMAATRAKGTNVSEVCRKALERLAKRADKSAAQKEPSDE